jgi:hypothetical protein
MLVGTTYTVKYHFSTSLNISSVPHVPHANLHSCRSEMGTCTPNVAKTPGLVTHSAALKADLSLSGSSLAAEFTSDLGLETGNKRDTLLLMCLCAFSDLSPFNSRILLWSGKWIAISHVRFQSLDTYQYEVAIGAQLSVTEPVLEEKVSDAALITVWVINSIAVVFLLGMLALLFKHKKHPVIKAGSPRFSMTIVASGLLGLASVFLMGYPTEHGCMLRACMLCFSFTGEPFICLSHYADTHFSNPNVHDDPNDPNDSNDPNGPVTQITLITLISGVFGILSAKTMRIWLIFRKGSLRVVRVKDKHLW